jgi:hypothetical protein
MPTNGMRVTLCDSDCDCLTKNSVMLSYSPKGPLAPNNRANIPQRCQSYSQTVTEGDKKNIRMRDIVDQTPNLGEELCLAGISVIPSGFRYLNL